MIVLYYILLVFLLLLWFLFVYYFKISLIIDGPSLKIKSSFITLYKVSNDKFYTLITNLIPKDKVSLEKDIDYSKLISFVHINLIDNRINLSSINLYLIINFVLLSNETLLNYLLNSYVKTYNFKINVDNKNELYLHLKMRFNLGIIFLNVLLIKLRYRYEKDNQ